MPHDQSPREERSRFEEAVFRALHAQLRSKEKRPVLRASDSGVWVEWHGTGGTPLVYRIEGERWWHPATEEHAGEVAGRLLAGIREALSRSRPA
jgi:hypothetical protein